MKFEYVWRWKTQHVLCVMIASNLQANKVGKSSWRVWHDRESWKKQVILWPNINGKGISHIRSGIRLFHYPSGQTALRGIVGFLREESESLLLNQMSADGVTTLLTPRKWKMHRKFQRWNTKSLSNHKMLINELVHTKRLLPTEWNAWAISLVGCRVLIFHSVDCYYLWKLPPTGKYSWKQVKRCQEAVSLFSKNHVIFFFFFFSFLQMNFHEIILEYLGHAPTSCNTATFSLL